MRYSSPYSASGPQSFHLPPTLARLTLNGGRADATLVAQTSLAYASTLPRCRFPFLSRYLSFSVRPLRVRAPAHDDSRTAFASSDASEAPPLQPASLSASKHHLHTTMQAVLASPRSVASACSSLLLAQRATSHSGGRMTSACVDSEARATRRCAFATLRRPRVLLRGDAKSRPRRRLSSAPLWRVTRRRRGMWTTPSAPIGRVVWQRASLWRKTSE